MRTSTPIAEKSAFFIALLATAIALGAALAHALELPNKMALSGDEYFIAQKLYLGWNKLGFVLAIELVAILAVIWFSRQHQAAFRFGLAALAALVIAQTIFWIFTFPTNQITANWTLRPQNWEALRQQWEYSHLAGAAFQLFTMIFVICAVVQKLSNWQQHEHGAR